MEQPREPELKTTKRGKEVRKNDRGLSLSSLLIASLTSPSLQYTSVFAPVPLSLGLTQILSLNIRYVEPIEFSL
jgi:hypothetical protein